MRKRLLIFIVALLVLIPTFATEAKVDRLSEIDRFYNVVENKEWKSLNRKDSFIRWVSYFKS